MFLKESKRTRNIFSLNKSFVCTKRKLCIAELLYRSLFESSWQKLCFIYIKNSSMGKYLVRVYLPLLKTSMLDIKLTSKATVLGWIIYWNFVPLVTISRNPSCLPQKIDYKVLWNSFTVLWIFYCGEGLYLYYCVLKDA